MRDTTLCSQDTVGLIRGHQLLHPRRVPLHPPYHTYPSLNTGPTTHGIGGDPVVNHAHDPQPLPPHQEPIPGVHEQPHFPEFPEGSPPFIPPQHSRSPSFSRRDSPALMANIGAGCKYLLTPGHDYYVLPFSRHYTVSHTLFMRLFFRALVPLEWHYAALHN
jgi:hypothetical protein